MSEEIFDCELRVKVSKRQKAVLGSWGNRSFMIRKMIDEYPKLKARISELSEKLEKMEFGE